MDGSDDVDVVTVSVWCRYNCFSLNETIRDEYCN